MANIRLQGATLTEITILTGTWNLDLKAVKHSWITDIYDIVLWRKKSMVI